MKDFINYFVTKYKTEVEIALIFMLALGLEL